MDPPARTCARCRTPLTETAGGLICPACALEQALAADHEPDPSADGDAFPRTFGGYELLGEVGRGGMGLVFRARQLSLNRLVALKVLLYGSFSDQAGRRRFRAEAESTARLQHPNIVAVHEVGEQEGVPYLTMDLVDGPDLGRLCNGQPLPAEKAALLVRDIAQAVHAAHEAGVLHRDLKPSNILVGSDGRPRVTDFGLAKRNDTSASLGLTATGQVLGSPSYASPEQAAGRLHEIAAPTDVYGLGAILYYVITGRAPFVAATATQTLRLVLEAEPVAPRELNPGLPRDVETICLKCLEKDPARRYAGAAALADDLGRFLERRPILARPVSPLGRGWRWCRRHPAVAALTGALFVVLGTAVVVANLQTRRTERARRLAEHATQAAVTSRGDAEKLVTWLLDDLGTDIALSGHRDQVVKLARQTVAYYEKLPSEARSRATERRRARAQGVLGAALGAQAKFREAAESNGRAVAILERLRADGDDSEATFVDFVQARMQATSGLIGSARSPREATAIAEATVALTEPRASAGGASPAVRRCHARALWRLGVCYVREDDDARARTCYERALAIQRALPVEPESRDAVALESASISLNLLQVLGRMSDDRPLIRSLLLENVAVVQQVLERQPSNIHVMELLASLQDNLSSFYVGQLAARDALHWRREATAIWERCRLLDPSRIDYRVHVSMGRTAARAIEAAQGQVTQALAGWRADLDACMDLPISSTTLHELSSGWRHLAWWLARTGDRRGAADALARQRAVLARIAGEGPAETMGNPRDGTQLSIAAAEVALELGDLDVARANASPVIAFADQFPSPVQSSRSGPQRSARGVLAWSALLAGDFAGAEAAGSAEVPPAHHPFNLRTDIAGLRIPRAIALARLGREAEARALIEPSVAVLRDNLAPQPDHCASLEDLAWAVYAEAVAQPAGAGQRRKALLDEASALVAAMTDDYRELRSVRDLRRWIAVEQAKAGSP